MKGQMPPEFEFFLKKKKFTQRDLNPSSNMSKTHYYRQIRRIFFFKKFYPPKITIQIYPPYIIFFGFAILDPDLEVCLVPQGVFIYLVYNLMKHNNEVFVMLYIGLRIKFVTLYMYQFLLTKCILKPEELSWMRVVTNDIIVTIRVSHTYHL